MDQFHEKEKDMFNSSETKTFKMKVIGIFVTQI